GPGLIRIARGDGLHAERAHLFDINIERTGAAGDQQYPPVAVGFVGLDSDGAGDNRQLEPEAAAFVGRAVDANFAAHHADQLLANTEAEAGAAVAVAGPV